MKKLIMQGVVFTSMLLAFTEESEAITLGQIAENVKTSEDGVFGSTELVSHRGSLPQWQNVMAQMNVELKSYQGCAVNRAACRTPKMQNWHDMLKSARHADPLAKLNTVNRYFNAWKYKTDRESYGVSEHWATPAEFMNNSGDCEDYAIAKYFTLNFLGFNDSQMRLVSVVDTIKGIGHSVLAVNAAGSTYILDNNTNGLFRDTQYKHYVPKYSVNQSGRWVHARANVKPARATATQASYIVR